MRIDTVILTFKEWGDLLQSIFGRSRSEALVFVLAVVVAIVIGVIFRKAEAQALQRLQAAAEAYAERELAHDQRIPTREFHALSRSAFPG